MRTVANISAEFAWLIGLYEGEGCVTARPHGGACVRIHMNDEDVIRRANEIMGGKVYSVASKTAPRGKTFLVTIYNKMAVRELITAMRPYLSARRQEQIDKVLRHMSAWKSQANALKTHCKSGHEFTPDNTGINPTSGSRYCRECMRRWNLESYFRRVKREKELCHE